MTFIPGQVMTDFSCLDTWNHFTGSRFFQQKLFSRKHLFKRLLKLFFSHVLLFPETNPKEIPHLSDCMIVIMTDESQKWKIASLECASDLFGLFFPCSLFPLSSLTLHHSVCLFSDSPLSSCFISPYISLSCSPVCLHIPPASFCPCLSKECFFNNRMMLHNSSHYANLSFIQCIKKCFLCRGQNKSPSGDIQKKEKTRE